MIYLMFFTMAGAPETLLTPTIITYKKVSDGADVADPPSITEIGGGFYKFTATPTEAIAVSIDGGASLTNAFERYKVMQITPNDDNLDAAITESIDTINDFTTATVSGAFNDLDAPIVQLNELYKIFGLDPSAPLTVTMTGRTTSGINQIISVDSVNKITVVTRI